MKWRTRDGREIELPEMDDDHLVNAFAVERKKFKERTGLNWFPGITGHPIRGLAPAINCKAFHEECSRRAIEWDIDGKNSYDRGAGDSTGLLDKLVVSASKARTPIEKSGFEKGKPGAIIVRVSLNLDDE